jgi:hypothetical protein
MNSRLGVGLKISHMRMVFVTKSSRRSGCKDCCGTVHKGPEYHVYVSIPKKRNLGSLCEEMSDKIDRMEEKGELTASLR